jgi:hypothetical protein
MHAAQAVVMFIGKNMHSNDISCLILNHAQHLMPLRNATGPGCVAVKVCKLVHDLLAQNA